MSRPNFHTKKSSPQLLAIEMKRTQMIMKTPVYLCIAT